ncbi:hypothetical protein H7E67_01925 [Clostridium gasigenes]|uniref:phage/plasmid primase, P4 family n=1 Tax=Clostridium gasigenes TaxID=94869 RepID=UPI00162706B9|nr:phage/plasmid primase, P4 family [Clostridium gasigenes]MBB6622178.1 hypothetical protein [Clostridium gasigenes]
MNYEDILQRFEGAVGKGYKHKAICPVHNDTEPSLGISYKGGRTVLNCLSHNCNIVDILKGVGLTIDDLTGKKQTMVKGNGFNSLEDVEKHLLNDEYEGFKTTNVYKYFNEDGTLAYLKTRKEKVIDGKKDKKFQFFRYEKGNLFNSLEDGIYYEVFEGANIYSKKEKPGKKIEIHYQPKVLYNLLNVIEAKKKGKTIFIVEGEKDVDTLTSIGVSATTSPTGGGNGNNKWLNEYSEYFKGADIVVISDNDQPGKDFTKLVKRSLLDYCYKVRTLIISTEPKGDVSSWYLKLNDKGEAFKLLIEQIADIKPSCPYWYSVKEAKESGAIVYKVKLNKFLLATRLKEVLNVMYVSDSKINEPLTHIYSNGVYEAVGSIRGQIQEYLHPEIISTSITVEVEKMIREASYNDIVFPSEMTGNEAIINVGNGLLDTRTMILKPHSPDYKTIFQLKCNYDPNAVNSGLWDNYINHLSDNDEEVKKVLQEFAGLVLSNYQGYKLKGGFALYGKPNTGKTVYLEALSGVVGEASSGVLGLQELNERFATNVLYGKRLVYDGDMSGEGLASVDIFKKITGGDKVTVEFKGKDRISYKYPGVYAFACNELPVLIAEKGEAIHNRLNIIRCDKVVESKVVGLVEQIVEKESDYIFQWALEGIKRLRANNWTLSPCKNMEDVKKEYKALSDSLFEFILEVYDVTGSMNDRASFKDFKEKYIDHCIEEGRVPIKKRAEYEKRIKSIKGMDFGQVKGIYYVKGIEIKGLEGTIVNDEDCPFKY